MPSMDSLLLSSFVCRADDSEGLVVVVFSLLFHSSAPKQSQMHPAQKEDTWFASIISIFFFFCTL